MYRSKKYFNNLGFTLIEATIVVIIISVIVAVALPDFNKTIGLYNLDSSARELASDIRSLQQNALKHESAGFEILFNTGTESYRLINTDVGVLSPYKIKKLPAGIDLVFSNFKDSRLIFAANGNPAGGIGGHISLRDHATGTFLYVIIDSIGRVRVSDTPPS
ncbi:MAG: hypothetical protein A4E55_01459 [Pelotomaculum sp. PtaU1.Bin035]|nr:MAG: hypothetical protein A4E55_01459 [Pelotomaculum sp. PtaU1.Bin035]